MSQKQSYPFTLSSVLLDSLIQAGTPYLFGVAGSAERDLFDHLGRDEYRDRLTFIQGNSEYPAARMSLGYARASEQVAPLIMHVQLGPANAALALYDANISTIPMLVFTVGHVSAANDHRESTYGYYRAPELLREYCKHVYRIVDGRNGDQIIQRALRLAGTPPEGPVFLTVGQDVVEAPLSRKPLKKTHSYAPAAPDDAVREATTALTAATQPVIITQRMKTQASVTTLVQVAEKVGAAVFEVRPSGMNFPASHPLHQGFLSDEASQMRQYLAASDVILSLDCFYPPDVESARHIQVSDNPFVFNENADQKIAAPTASFLTALLHQLGDTSRHTDHVEGLRLRHEATRRQWATVLHDKFEEDPPSPQRIWHEINRVFHHGRDYVVFFAPAFTQRLSVLRYLERDTPGCYYSALSAAMGSAGEAIGVQLADRRRVLCVLGDFEAHVAQLPTLLWTCAHHAIPVIWIVLDNATGATVKRAYWMYGKHARATRTFVGVDLDAPRTDWVKIADANHVPARRCEQSCELQSCLAYAVNTPGPVLLSIATQAFEEPLEGYGAN